MPKTKKSRRAVEDTLHGLRELAKMIGDGVQPEERFTVHTIEIPEPAKYNAKAVQSLRQKLGVSQAIFAKMLGVSTILVQSWERGVRQPSPLARRLLDTVSDDPGRWLGRVWESRPGAARRAG
jgi:putative transcriptional regulator